MIDFVSGIFQVSGLGTISNNGSGILNLADLVVDNSSTGIVSINPGLNGDIVLGSVYGEYGFIKAGSGTLVIEGDQSNISGEIVVRSGDLFLNSTTISNLTLDGGTVLGNGIVSTLNVSLNSAISPGKSIALESVSSSSPLQFNHFYNDSVDNNSIVYNGSSALDISSFNLYSSINNVLSQGTELVILNNNSSLPLSGEFQGFPEGAVISSGGTTPFYLRISYIGGDGNDMTLTALGAIPTITLTPTNFTEVTSSTTSLPATQIVIPTTTSLPATENITQPSSSNVSSTAAPTLAEIYLPQTGSGFASVLINLLLPLASIVLIVTLVIKLRKYDNIRPLALNL